MLCGDSGATALARWAEQLRRDGLRTDKESGRFPMYVVSLETLLAMTSVRPHEELLKIGELWQFNPKMGRAIFVSHQWVGHAHPDPHFEQLHVLQGALRDLVSGRRSVMTDMAVEVYFGRLKGLSAAEWQARPIYVWYDYFSCPQASPGPDLAKAIDSIPTYVEWCEDFVCLCPPLVAEDGWTLLGQFSWSTRAWCRLEQITRELSCHGSHVVMISSEQRLTLSQFTDWLNCSAGEGTLTYREDYDKLGGVIHKLIRKKLHFHLLQGDFPSFRFLLNLRSRFLKGLPQAALLEDVVPGFHATPTVEPASDPSTELAEKFLFQNGFKHVSEVDARGWSPLCYAVLGGDARVVAALLQQKADVNDRLRRDQPQGSKLVKKLPVLSLSAMMKNTDAMKVLLNARAHLHARDSIGATVAISAGWGSDAEGCRLLRAAGVSFRSRDIMRLLPADYAAYFNNLEALREILAFEPDVKFLKHTLHFAVLQQGGNPSLVPTLLSAGVDINQRWSLPMTCLPAVLGKWWSVKHSISPSQVTLWGRHQVQSTPLMSAIIGGSFPQAAFLIQRNADVHLKNSKGYSALDLAREVSAPKYLLEALQGNMDPAEPLLNALQCEMDGVLSI